MSNHIPRDIVDILRYDAGSRPGGICEAAAKEIERLRADLAARKEAPAPQRVKPLTYKECTDVPVRMDMWFREVMAARGIEVGE